MLYLVCPKLATLAVVEGTAKLLKPLPVSSEKKVLLEWKVPVEEERLAAGVVFTLQHSKPINQVAWHFKGNYFATVMQTGVSDGVLIHSLQRQSTQNPFSKKSREVQKVAFHPVQPLFFVATKTHVRIYNLQTQVLFKKLVTGCRWISSMAVHPKGDNVILGSFDRRLCWFDLDLSTKPFKTIRYHRLALRQVAFHSSYPLFASSSDDATVQVFHGMVYSDLLQNPLIVPVKILKGHAPDAQGLGVMDIAFHPRQPWLFSAGADSTVRLFT